MGVPGGGEARQQGGSGPPPPPPPPADPLPPVPLPLRTGTDTTCHDGAQKSGNVYEKGFDATDPKKSFSRKNVQKHRQKSQKHSSERWCGGSCRWFVEPAGGAVSQ